MDDDDRSYRSYIIHGFRTDTLSIAYHPFHGNDEFIELTDEEYSEAFDRGKMIRCSSVERHFKDNRDFVRDGVDGLRVHQLGEVCARAIAKALNLPWVNSLDTFKGPDLPHNIEARLIGVERYGLRVYDTDDDSKRVVGCVIERGRERLPYRLPGWINAKYGKKSEWWMDPLDRKRPAFFVPQYHLWSLNILRRLINGVEPSYKA